MGFLNIFKGKKKNLVRVELDKADPDAINKILMYENAELKQWKAKKIQEDALARERKKDINEEENVKISLQEQGKDLRAQNNASVFSMKSFWGLYFGIPSYLKKFGMTKNGWQKWRRNLSYYSFNRSSKLDKFGDITFGGNGLVYFMNDSAEIVHGGRDMKDVIQSLPGLGNDIIKSQIVLWMDEDGAPIENIMEYEANDLLPTDDGKLRFSKVRKRPVYEIIQRLGEENQDVRSQLEEAEMLITEQQDTIDKLRSESRINEKTAETSRAELQHQEEKVIGIDRVFRSTTRDLVQARNLYVIQEDALDKLESEIETMRKKAEREGVKLADERAFDQINRIRGTLINEMPDNFSQKIIPKSISQPEEE